MVQRALVIIPNRATFVTAWAVEEAVRISPDSQVYLADLAQFESRYKGIFGWIYWKFDNSLEVNNIRSILKMLCERYAITLISFSAFNRIKPRVLDSTENDLFERALRSNFAKLFGSGLIESTDISARIKKREELMFRKAMTSIEQIVEEMNINHIVTVNGRGFVDSCAVAVAKKKRITYGLIELSGESWDYYSVHDTTTHSPFEVQNKISQVWERDSCNFSLEEVDQIALSYFQSRFSPENEWRSFQKNDPIDLNSRDYVVFFPTSDHEFATFPEIHSATTEFKSQMDSFEETASICKQLNLTLCVRVHPHQKHSILAQSEDAIWQEACSKLDITFISSASGVDSVSLASNAYASVTHLSTIGAELAWLQIPVAFTAHSTYSNLLPDIACFTSEDLRSFLSKPQVSVNRSNLVRWAFYMSRGEFLLKIFSIRNFSEVRIGQVTLNQKRIFWYRIARFFAKFKLYRSPVFIKN